MKDEKQQSISVPPFTLGPLFPLLFHQYGGLALMVVGALIIGNPLAFSFRAAMEALGFSRHDATGDIFATLARHHEKGFGIAMLKMIDAFLQHSNVLHNRVYTSIASIAETANLATSTVEVMEKILIENGLIHPVTGDERVAGDPCGVNDGPHRAAERGSKRKGRYPVTVYDISGFFYCLPRRTINHR